jgi:hypothetical protein
MRPAFAQSAAVAAAVFVAFVASVVWLVHWRSGAPGGGSAAPFMPAAVPAGILALTALWLLLRGLCERLIRFAAAAALGVYLAVAYGAAILSCEANACFDPAANRFLGWFLLGGVAAAALVHHVVLTLLRRAGGEASGAGTVSIAPLPDGET